MKKYTKQFLTVFTIGIPSILASTCAIAAPYVSLQGGSANSRSVHPWVLHEKKSTPTGRFAAGLDWSVAENLNVGIEAGAQGYRKKSTALRSAKLSSNRVSLDLLAGMDLFLSRYVDLKAKAGIAYVHPKYKVDLGTEDNTLLSKSFTYNDYVVPKASVGFGYNANKYINLNMAVNHEFKKNNSIPSATSILAGVKVSFA